MGSVQPLITLTHAYPCDVGVGARTVEATLAVGMKLSAVGDMQPETGAMHDELAWRLFGVASAK